MLDDESLAEFAGRLGFCVTETHKLIGKSQGLNPRVRMRTIQQICERLKLPIGDLIYYNFRMLPKNEESFTSIKFGYFIDNNRHNYAGEETWFSEDVNIAVDSEATASSGRLCFTGTIKNCINLEYEVKAERLSDHLFYMVSASRDPRRSFVGCANLYTNYNDDDLCILAGTWSGLDVSGDPAVFRWVLANRSVSKEGLEMICDDININTILESENFHSSIKNIEPVVIQ